MPRADDDRADSEGLEAAWGAMLSSVEAASRLGEETAWTTNLGVAGGGRKSAVRRSYPWESFALERGRNDVALDPERYRRWYATRYGNPGPPGSAAASATSPLFSVLVPVFRPERWHLERCVASVRAQTYPKWELCLCDDASGDASLAEYLRELQADPRIHVTVRSANGGISAATNDALACASGDFVALLDNDDELVEVALEKMAEAIAANPEVDLLYSDEDKLDLENRLCHPTLKPAWSADHLLSTAYTCHLTVIRTSLVNRIGGFRSRFDGSQDYDITLRASESARQVLHVPEVLYHWRIRPGSAADDPQAKPWAHLASEAALNDALRRRGEDAYVERGPLPGTYHVRRSLPPETTATVVVVVEESARRAAAAAELLSEAPGIAQTTAVLVDARREAPDAAHLAAAFGELAGTTVLQAPGASWAEAANLGAQAADGDCVVFASEALLAAAPGWLRALAEHAMRPKVAAVGPRIATPDRLVFSAGALVGLLGAAAPLFNGLPPHSYGYLVAAELTRNCSAVPRWCLGIARETFGRAGGFDPRFGAFAEIDLCLRLGEEGLRCVYTPLSRLAITPGATHYEVAGDETALFVQRWAQLIEGGDPTWNPHLSRTSSFGALEDGEESAWPQRVAIADTDQLAQGR